MVRLTKILQLPFARLRDRARMIADSQYVNHPVSQNTVRDNHKPRSPLTLVRLAGIKPMK